MEEIEILCEELEDIILEDTREVVTVDKPVYPELEDLIVKPTTEEQKFKSSKYGYNNVTVEAIQDENLKAENIKSGTEILGVKGNFTGGKYAPRYVYQPITFQGYTGTELDREVSMLDTTNFTKMNNMFNSCKNLTSLDLSGWNTSNVTTMSSMFGNCDSITELNLSNFDTSNVTTMGSMFESMDKLTRLDLSSFDTSNVTSMGYMFNNCTKLQYLDIRNFTFDKVTSYTNVFNYMIPSNCLIIVKSETERQWILKNGYSGFKNIKTVAEIGE